MAMKEHLAKMYGVDARALVIFRSTLGILLFYDLLERSGILWFRFRDAACFYSDDGMFPRPGSSQMDWHFSIFNAAGSPAVVWIIFLVGMFADLAFARGVSAKQAAFISLVVHAGAYFRNRSAVIGADIMAMRSLFMVATDPWLPLERNDLLLDKDKEKRSSSYVLSIGAVALVVGQALVYCGAALSKTTQAWWVEGIAARSAMESPFYGRRENPLTLWILEQSPFILKMLSQATVVVEGVIAVLLTCPIAYPELCRMIACILLLSLHLGLLLTLRLGCFPIYSITMIIPLLPRQFWDWCLPLDWLAHHPIDTGMPATLGTFDRLCMRCLRLLRVGVCVVALAFCVLTMPSDFSRCDNANLTRFACWLPEWVRQEFPVSPEVKLVFASVGLFPFSFSMFDNPRNDHGWLVIVGQEEQSNRMVYLPTGNPVLSVEQAFKRPDARWFPSMRWRQFFFSLSMSQSRGPVLREQFARYFCRRPPHAEHRLGRIQMFFVPNVVKNLTAKVIDYPFVQPRQILNWFCTDDWVARWKTGNCTACSRPLLEMPPHPGVDEQLDRPPQDGQIHKDADDDTRTSSDQDYDKVDADVDNEQDDAQDVDAPEIYADAVADVYDHGNYEEVPEDKLIRSARRHEDDEQDDAQDVDAPEIYADADADVYDHGNDEEVPEDKLIRSVRRPEDDDEVQYDVLDDV